MDTNVIDDHNATEKLTVVDSNRPDVKPRSLSGNNIGIVPLQAVVDSMSAFMLYLKNLEITDPENASKYREYVEVCGEMRKYILRSLSKTKAVVKQGAKVRKRR